MQKKTTNGAKLAQDLFGANYNCAQSTLAGILSANGRAYEDRMRLAGAFGAGVAQSGGLCGALTGALMAFGYMIPMKGDVAAWKAEVALVSKEFIARYRKQFGEVNCNALAGCDMSSTDERQKFHDDGGRERVCTPMVGKSVEMAIKLLKERK